MAAVIWTDEASEQGIDLGEPFALFAALGSMARVSGDGDEWVELFAIPDFLEQQADAGWLAKAKEQADRFAQQYNSELDDHSLWVLTQLTDA